MTMITPSYLGETIEYSSLHACRSTLEDPKGHHTARWKIGETETPGFLTDHISQTKLHAVQVRGKTRVLLDGETR